MSKKYYDRLLTGSGSTERAVKSKFGMKMLESMGWTKGAELGKNENGLTECIQIKRREEGQALGAEPEGPSASFKWNDSFWDDVYNSATKGIEITAKKLVQSDSSDDDDHDDDNSDT